MITEGCWRLGATLYFHAVWRGRVQHFDENNIVTAKHHMRPLANRLQQGYRTKPKYIQRKGPQGLVVAAARVVEQVVCAPWDGAIQPVVTHDSKYVLFFDGGSRGNPGPGEAGAAIVRVAEDGGQVQLVWAGSMSYAAMATTNNYAENMGLLTGLVACGRHGYSPVYVVGDSALIKSTCLGASPLLAPPYTKMADYLANQVMDKRTSAQVQFETLEHDTTRWQRLTEYVGRDIGHWMLNNGDAAPMGGASVIP
ncbi:hypothetical protein PC110_g4431 [Phytophthora cactorum]|uniref:RNase H type-1 domain-containing protein n=1 Tax=Phytophthora cactorum TaxID=29920 RepID=A0A329SRW5_9STRA|nr:hypothetical protein PC110_g4431 [Phytophthora cactorum]